MFALMAGTLPVSYSGFAAPVQTVKGKADITRIERSAHQYRLKCGDESMIICYEKYADGSLGINDNGNIIAAYPADVQPAQPTFMPDPAEPGNYQMIGSLLIELAPDAQLQMP